MCISEEGMRMVLQRAVEREMSYPDYFYLYWASFPNDMLKEPWLGEDAVNYTDVEKEKWKLAHRPLKQVCDLL